MDSGFDTDIHIGVPTIVWLSALFVEECVLPMTVARCCWWSHYGHARTLIIRDDMGYRSLHIRAAIYG